ncbi:MAG: hypothetical protein WBM90_02250, partial [Acidimicrobiia bacterium]
MVQEVFLADFPKMVSNVAIEKVAVTPTPISGSATADDVFDESAILLESDSSPASDVVEGGALDEE